ncbi:hypothetical protein TNCV_1983661 [Trichonephila clavipes]|nr:hypothetical protein TNCV_1983661 [Trichonephila clavipes]
MACDAEDCGFQMLNDDEIVTSVLEESDPVDDETDEDEDNNNNNESSKGSFYAGAFSALETAMEWYEQQSETLQQKIGVLIFHNKGEIATFCIYFAFSSSTFPACDDFPYS